MSTAEASEEPPKLTFGQILRQLKEAKEANASIEHLKNIDLAPV